MSNSKNEFGMALFVSQLQLSIHIQPMCWCSARVVRMVSTNGADGILSSNILSDRLYLLYIPYGKKCCLSPIKL